MVEKLAEKFSSSSLQSWLFGAVRTDTKESAQEKIFWVGTVWEFGVRS